MDVDFGSQLASLVRGFETDSMGSASQIQGLIRENPRAFCSAAAELWNADEHTRASHFLLEQLVATGLVTHVLCDPALSKAQAMALARAAAHIDPKLDVSLAKDLADCVISGSDWLRTADVPRLMAILGEISDGTHIFPSLARLMRTADPYLRSKAVLLMGRGNRSSKWAQVRLAEPDPRVRANAIEGLWGTDGAAIRELLHTAVSDPNNRVAGNAVLALHRLGDCSAIPELLKMARHESKLFRVTAAWAMGASGDPRFAEVLAHLLSDPATAVRARAFAALSQLRTATARSRQAGRWRVGGMLTGGDQAKNSRRVQISIVADEGEPPRLLPTHFIPIEDGHAVSSYRVIERPVPEAMSVIFVFPRTAEPASEPWNQAALQCLTGKRPIDLWALVPYVTPYDAGGDRSASDPGPQFTAKLELLQRLFQEPAKRMDCTDFWDAMARPVEADGGRSRGRRHLIVYHPGGAEEFAGLEKLGLAILESGDTLQVVSPIPSPPLEELCARTGGCFHLANGPDIACRIEQAYRNLLARYEIVYQPASPVAVNLKVRVHSPSGWGETDIPIALRRLT